MKSVKRILTCVASFGFLYAADTPWHIGIPHIGVGVMDSKSDINDKKNNSTSGYFEIGGENLIKRDFKLTGMFSGNWWNDPTMFSDQLNYPATPTNDAFNREGKVRDSWWDVKVSVGYNLLGLTNIQSSMLFLNVGYALRFLERDWGYNHIKWNYSYVPIELQGETYFSSLPAWFNSGKPTSLLYGINYHFPFAGYQAYHINTDYKVKGSRLEFYIGESVKINDRLDFFGKVTFSFSGFDENLQNMPTIKTYQSMSMVQFGLRGNPFRQLGL